MELFAQTQQKSRLGQILLDKQLVSQEQLSKAMERQATTGERLGDILTQWNVVTQRHIESALRAQRALRLAAYLATATMTPLIAACGGGGGGGGGTSPTATATARAVTLSAPTDLGAQAPSATQAKLAWTDESGGLAKYRIYRDGSATAMAEVTGSSYTDYTVDAATAYVYQVRAIDPVNTQRTSGLSNFASITTPAAGSTILFSSDFEGTDLSSWAQVSLGTMPYSAQVVDAPTHPVRSGTKSIRMELHSTDPDVAGSRRTELAQRTVAQLSEHWYAFSVYIPTDYATDPSAESLAQWHVIPDSNLGETGMSPAVALITQNGRWSVHRRWDDAAVSSNTSVLAKGNLIKHDLGIVDADKGRWVDWVFHIKWGWHSSQEPKFEVYKNGQLVINQNGLPNTMNDATGPYFKMGIYKWDWKEDPMRSVLTTRVVYFDRVLIGNGNSALRDMQ